MASKGQKKKDSGRASAASKDGAASSMKGGTESKVTARQQHFSVWPEWSDADINAEKWDTPQKPGGKEKGKSPSLQFFDDPDGVLNLPPTLEVSQWKRFHEHYPDKAPLVVEDPNCPAFDLLTPNEHIHHCEVIRWIIGQITALWKLNGTSLAFVPDLGSTSQTEFTNWKPWEHIYSISKLGKGPNIPQYNHYGKYAVRLFWMGCWRKVLVDDSLPFDEDEQMLLPSTTIKHELWPMLLSKALIKVLSLDYSGGNLDCEFGEQSVMHALTGWLPEPIPIMSPHLDAIWDLVKSTCPEFTLRDPNDSKGPVESSVTSSDQPDGVKKEGEGKDPPVTSKEGKKGGKDPKKDREPPKTEKPQAVVFVSYFNPPKLPKTFCKFRDSSKAAEVLRTVGLSHSLPHPLLISRTRSCPLVAPPIPPPEPAWKSIRQPRRKFYHPTDEPLEEKKPRPEQWVEISSPYLNYKIQPTDIPQQVTGRKSSGKALGSRPSTAAPLEEVDETQPDSPVPPTVDGTQDDPATKVQEPQSALTSAAGDKPPGQMSAANSQLGGATNKLSPVPPGQDSKSDKRQSHASAASSNVSQTKKGEGVDPATDSASGAPKTAGEQSVKSDTQGAGDSKPPNATTPLPQVVEQSNNDLWVHWQDFTQAFKSIILYHKPQSYPYRETASDFKTGTGGMTQSAVSGKKPGAASAGGQSKGGTQSPGIGLSGDEKQPIFLSVDSLKPIQILVSFSALSKWLEPPPPASDSSSSTLQQQVTSTSHVTNSASKMHKKSAVISEAPTIYSDRENESNVKEVTGGVFDAFKRRANLPPGIVVAEPYSWKSLVIGNPVLSLKTTGCKSVMLNLSPGRHILRFHMSAPLAWVINLSSTTRFYFGDEENVMSTVVNESLRFQEHAVQLVQKIGKSIQNFDDPESFREAMEDLRLNYNPTDSQPDNIQVFRKAFYMTVAGLMGDALTSDAVFGLRCLTSDLQTESVMEAAIGRKNQEEGDENAQTAPAPTSGKKDSKKDAKGAKPPVTPAAAADAGRNTGSSLDIWKDRDPNEDEIECVTSIQSAWKGFYTRAVIAAQEVGSSEHVKAKEQLQKVWSFLETNIDTCGLTLLRSMFKTDPDQLQRFPFAQDEWTKIAYCDYNGQYQEQPASTWFVLFRSVFTVEDPVLLVPKLSSGLNTAFLRVIDNDTGEEIPKVFMRVAPYNYARNQRGYTFFCEARTTDVSVPPGRWRVRLIGSQAPLPVPVNGESLLNTNFDTREIKDYYVPNNKNIIMRYSVRVTEDHLLSLQMQTSKPDVFFQLEVLDHETVVMTTRGKGHAVIPAFIFHKDTASRIGSAKSKKSTSGDRKISKADSVIKKADIVALGGEKEEDTGTEAGPHLSKPMSHKYIIQARVLKNSWPLSQASWAHVAMLKELEKEEMKANYDERPGSSKSGGAAGANKAGSKQAPPAKNLKPEKSGKAGSSRPTSRQFDADKPHWLLRVVVDASEGQAGDCDIRKDTERLEQIRAMKQAWERADPGRAERAAARRAAFLAKYLVPADAQVPSTTEGTESRADVDDTTTSGVPGDEGTADDSTQIAAAAESAAAAEKEAKSAKSRRQSMPKGAPRKESLITATAEEGIDETSTLAKESTEVDMLTLEPPPGPPPKMVLKPLDLSPYTVKAKDGVKILVDEDELSREKEAKVAEFARWNRVRAEMKKRREDELAARNQEKIKQIQDYEALQELVDSARADITGRKEALRQRILQAEQEKLDAIALMESGGAANAPGAGDKPASASKKGGKKSPKGSAKGSKKGSAKGKKG